MGEIRQSWKDNVDSISYRIQNERLKLEDAVVNGVKDILGDDTKTMIMFTAGSIDKEGEIVSCGLVEIGGEFSTTNVVFGDFGDKVVEDLNLEELLAVAEKLYWGDFELYND